MGILFSVPEVRGVVKWVVHRVTTKCEIERLLSDDQVSSDMTLRVAQSIGQSRSLPRDIVLIVVQRQTGFMPEAVAGRIAECKGIGRDRVLVRANLRLCMCVLLAAHNTIAHISRLQKEEFCEANPEHLRMLAALWVNLFPDKRRTSNDVVSDDWMELGFQSKNPISDLRGGGMLGLHQLVAFSEMYPEKARALLTESVNPRRYFPFAATGINVTAFVLDLINEGRVTARLFSAHQVSGMGEDDAGEEDRRGLRAVASVYAEQYLAFGEEWVRKDPFDLGVMAFPGIFDTVKKAGRAQMPRLLPPNLRVQEGLGKVNPVS